MSTSVNKMDHAEQWYEQLRTRSSLAEEDAASYKEILLDYMDELEAKGLTVEEAFKIASIRLEINPEIEEKCEMAGSAVPVIRKILLVFSGILIFFLLYNVLQVCLQSMCYYSYQMNLSPGKIFQNSLYFTVFFHFIFLIAVLLVIKCEKTIFRKIEGFRIRPFHAFLLILLIFGLALANYQLRYRIRAVVPRDFQNMARLAETTLYSGYIFSSFAIIIFLLMLKKVVKSGKKKWESGPADSDHHLKMEYSQSYRKLISEGWKEKEAIALIKIRHRIPDSDQPRYLTNEERAEKFHLLIFSGSLVYLFLYYLLNSTSKIFLTMLQYLENDPVKNFSWLRWYIYSFYLLLIFFTISLYIKDMNLLDRLKELNFLKLRRMFFLTVVLGVVNCFFGAISKRSLGNIYELKVKLSDIIIFSDLVFPIVISLCFFALFTKYYGEQING